MTNEPENIPGYDQLTANQQKDFKRILDKYMSAKGTDARNDIIINHVEAWQGCFNISTRQWGIKGYAVLNPVNNTWY